MVFAKKCGVEPSTVFEAIRGGLAGSPVMETKTPMMLKGNFEPGGKLKFQLKDANNVLDTGHRAGAPMPLTSMVTEQIQWLCANGFAEDDHSTMVHYYENLAGVDVRAAE
jgi:2-hydroxy-3-oxopropionate reductase